MPYKILIDKQVNKKLLGLPTKIHHRIVEKIILLGDNPDDTSLDIKKLIGSHDFRLRIGDWRIVFNRDDINKIIRIKILKSRGDVYK